MLRLHSPIILLLLIQVCDSLQSISNVDTKKQVGNTPYAFGGVHDDDDDDSNLGRRTFLFVAGSTIGPLMGFPERSEAKSYSANARNLERMNVGDMSGGSLYDNYPTTSAGQRRRAMTGCKSPTAREEASKAILNIDSLSEKDCNQMVLEGNPQFMLESLRNLDCPSCPYGIATSRKS